MSPPSSASKNKPSKNQGEISGKQRYVPPNRQLTFNGLHGLVSQKIEPFITTAVRTSNPTNRILFSS
jgi:hypothetical protein